MQLALQVDRAGMIDFFVCQSIAEREKKSLLARLQPIICISKVVGKE